MMLTIIRTFKGRARRCLFFMIILLAVLSFPSMKYIIERTHSEWIIGRLRDYEVHRSQSIQYHYKEDDRGTINEVIGKTQKFISEVDKNFQREDSKPFKLVIFPSRMEFNSGLRLSAQERTLGAYYGGNIFLLSPSELSGSETPIENVILHEYTHLLVEELTKGKHPIWLTEGIALQQEYLITGVLWGQAGQREPYELDHLENHFYRLDTYHAYHSSFYRVRYLEEIYGPSFILELLYHLGEGQNYKSAVENLAGKDIEDIENSFLLWYEGLNYGKL